MVTNREENKLSIEPGICRFTEKEKGVDGAPGGRDAAVDAAGTKAVAF